MSKYKILFMSIFFIIFTTIIAQQMESYNKTKLIYDGVTNDVQVNITGILGFIKTYFSLITFKIEGFPVILNILIFYPINIITIYFLAEIIKDIIPFT